MQIYKIFFLEGHNFLDIQYDLLSRRGGPDTADHWIPIPGASSILITDLAVRDILFPISIYPPRLFSTAVFFSFSDNRNDLFCT